MRSTSDPVRVDHPTLRDLAIAAGWVAKLEEAVEVLEDLISGFAEDGESEGGEREVQEVETSGHEEDPLTVALSVVEERYEEEDRDLEGRVIAWLAEDPEHWSIFRLVVLDPWQEQPGVWRAEAPRWARTLATDATLAHFQHDPYGRRAQLDLDT